MAGPLTALPAIPASFKPDPPALPPSFRPDPWEPGNSPQEPLQEQHPDIGFKDRALLMNLSGDPEVARKYLESKGFQVHPRGGYDFSVKRPTESVWRVVDPEGFDWQDLTDIGGDVGVGAASVLGFGAGGTLGSVAAGAGAEAARQGLGRLAGLPNTAETAATGSVKEGLIGLVPGALNVAGRAGRGAIQAVSPNLGRLGRAAAAVAPTALRAALPTLPEAAVMGAGAAGMPVAGPLAGVLGAVPYARGGVRRVARALGGLREKYRELTPSLENLGKGYGGAAEAINAPQAIPEALRSGELNFVGIRGAEPALTQMGDEEAVRQVAGGFGGAAKEAFKRQAIPEALRGGELPFAGIKGAKGEQPIMDSLEAAKQLGTGGTRRTADEALRGLRGFETKPAVGTLEQGLLDDTFTKSRAAEQAAVKAGAPALSGRAVTARDLLEETKGSPAFVRFRFRTTHKAGPGIAGTPQGEKIMAGSTANRWIRTEPFFRGEGDVEKLLGKLTPEERRLYGLSENLVSGTQGTVYREAFGKQPEVVLGQHGKGPAYSPRNYHLLWVIDLDKSRGGHPSWISIPLDAVEQVTYQDGRSMAWNEAAGKFTEMAKAPVAEPGEFAGRIAKLREGEQKIQAALPPAAKGSLRGVSPRIREIAAEHGVDPRELMHRAEYHYETEQMASMGKETVDLVKKARKLTGLTPSKIRRWEESGKDYSSYPGLDAKASDLAQEFGWASREMDEFGMAKSGEDFAARLWEFLRYPTPKVTKKYDARYLDRAAEEMKREKPPEGEVPF